MLKKKFISGFRLGFLLFACNRRRSVVNERWFPSPSSSTKRLSLVAIHYVFRWFVCSFEGSKILFSHFFRSHINVFALWSDGWLCTFFFVRSHFSDRIRFKQSNRQNKQNVNLFCRCRRLLQPTGNICAFSVSESKRTIVLMKKRERASEATRKEKNGNCARRRNGRNFTQISLSSIDRILFRNRRLVSLFHLLLVILWTFFDLLVPEKRCLRRCCCFFSCWRQQRDKT